MSFTYTTLTEALQGFTEDQGAEFAAVIPTLIMLGEIKLVRDLDLELFRGTATTAFTMGVATLAKPTDLVTVRSIHYTDASGKLTVLDERNYDFIKAYWPDITVTTASPRYYADQGETSWLIGGTPSGSNAVTVRYVKRPTGLAVDTPTTWLSTNAPDALLWACLIVAEQFLKADGRIETWKRSYVEALMRIKAEQQPEMGDSYETVATTPAKEG